MSLFFALQLWQSMSLLSLIEPHHSNLLFKPTVGVGPLAIVGRASVPCLSGTRTMRFRW